MKAKAAWGSLDARGLGDGYLIDGVGGRRENGYHMASQVLLFDNSIEVGQEGGMLLPIMVSSWFGGHESLREKILSFPTTLYSKDLKLLVRQMSGSNTLISLRRSGVYGPQKPRID